MSDTSVTESAQRVPPMRGEARSRASRSAGSPARVKRAERFDLRRWLARWRRRLTKPHSVREIWRSVTRRTSAHAARSLPAGKQLPLQDLAGELSAQLDRHPHTRAVMPHLALVERGLKRRDAGALPKMHPRHLHKACQQLEVLMGASVSAGLSRLHSSLQKQLAAHESRHEPAPASETACEGQVGLLVMNEVSLSTFMDADQQWEAVVAATKLGESRRRAPFGEVK